MSEYKQASEEFKNNALLKKDNHVQLVKEVNEWYKEMKEEDK